MSSEYTVLVLSQEDDPQLSMLKGLRHIVGHTPEAFAAAVNDPVIILAWSAPKKLLRDVFLMCKNVLWVHSRSAGLDSHFPGNSGTETQDGGAITSSRAIPSNLRLGFGKAGCRNGGPAVGTMVRLLSPDRFKA